MSRYQKKHSPTHHPDHNPTFISRFHLLRSIASSLFKLRAWQSFCTTSLHILFGLHLGLEPPPYQGIFHTLLHPISVLPDAKGSIRTECRSTSNYWNSAVWTHHSSSTKVALASCSSTGGVQAHVPSPPVISWTNTVIPSFWHSTYYQHWQPSASISIRAWEDMSFHAHTTASATEVFLLPVLVCGMPCHHICGRTWTIALKGHMWPALTKWGLSLNIQNLENGVWE